MSVVVSPTHHLLAAGPEQDGVLKLSRVAALGVAQRGVGVHDAQVAQVLQRHQVLALAQTVQPAAAERQCAKVLVDDVEEVLGSRQPAGHKSWIVHTSAAKYGGKKIEAPHLVITRSWYHNYEIRFFFYIQ